MITAGFWESTFRYTVVERLESRIGYGVRSESRWRGVVAWRRGVAACGVVAGWYKKLWCCMHVKGIGGMFADPDNPDCGIRCRAAEQIADR